MTEEENKLFTADQVKEYGEEMVRQYAQEKSNTHTFLTKVIQNPETTRIGNISDEELGNTQITLRGLKELELFSKEVYMDETWADYFNKSAEIATSTSLSKDGFLLRLSVTNKKELADVTPKRKKNKGWFRKKGSNEE